MSDDSCPHITDQVIPLNGGRFNVDQYLRVLRAKAVQDQTVLIPLSIELPPRAA